MAKFRDNQEQPAAGADAAVDERVRRLELELAETRNLATNAESRAKAAEEALASTEAEAQRAEAEAIAAKEALERKQLEMDLKVSGLKHNSEVATFWLSQDRYLQQVGQSAARMVRATHKRPARVKLPARILRKTKEHPEGVWIDQPEDAFLKRIKPVPLKDAGPKVAGGPGIGSGVAGSPEPTPGIRAADQ